MAVHHAIMQASQQRGMATGEPSFNPAFRRDCLLAGTDFHREKRPKQCLGEKCDVKMIACASAWAADARAKAHRIGVGFGVLVMASASALAVDAGLSWACSAYTSKLTSHPSPITPAKCNSAWTFHCQAVAWNSQYRIPAGASHW